MEFLVALDPAVLPVAVAMTGSASITEDSVTELTAASVAAHTSHQKTPAPGSEDDN